MCVCVCVCVRMHVRACVCVPVCVVCVVCVSGVIFVWFLYSGKGLTCTCMLFHYLACLTVKSLLPITRLASIKFVLD